MHGQHDVVGRQRIGQIIAWVVHVVRQFRRKEYHTRDVLFEIHREERRELVPAVVAVVPAAVANLRVIVLQVLHHPLGEHVLHDNGERPARDRVILFVGDD